MVSIVNCALCGESKDLLTKMHLRIKHNMSKEEYLRLHPEHDQARYWGEANQLRVSGSRWATPKKEGKTVRI